MNVWWLVGHDSLDDELIVYKSEYQALCETGAKLTQSWPEDKQAAEVTQFWQDMEGKKAKERHLHTLHVDVYEPVTALMKSHTKDILLHIRTVESCKWCPISGAGWLHSIHPVYLLIVSWEYNLTMLEADVVPSSESRGKHRSMVLIMKWTMPMPSLSQLCRLLCTVKRRS